jgi:hypothetical protein
MKLIDFDTLVKALDEITDNGTIGVAIVSIGHDDIIKARTFGPLEPIMEAMGEVESELASKLLADIGTQQEAPLPN